MASMNEIIVWLPLVFAIPATALLGAAVGAMFAEGLE